MPNLDSARMLACDDAVGSTVPLTHYRQGSEHEKSTLARCEGAAQEEGYFFVAQKEDSVVQDTWLLFTLGFLRVIVMLRGRSFARTNKNWLIQ